MDRLNRSALELRRVLPELTSSRLVPSQRLAAQLGLGRVLIKAECDRPLANFKVLGGVLAAARALDRHRARGPAPGHAPTPSAATTLLCASDGNHGLAVALAAQRLSVGARVYLPSHVSPWRAERIAALGARVEPVNGTYDDAVDAARLAARSGVGLLVADTSSDAADPVVADVVEGYTILSHEARQQWEALGQAAPTHVFVQAGVGGLAASISKTLLRQAERGSPPPRLIVVEPEHAACVGLGLMSAAPVKVPGDLSTCAEMLSCGLASALALGELLRAGAQAVTVGEAELDCAAGLLGLELGAELTPSSAAGLAGLSRCAADQTLRSVFGLDEHSAVLLIATEGAHR